MPEHVYKPGDQVEWKTKWGTCAGRILIGPDCTGGYQVTTSGGEIRGPFYPHELRLLPAEKGVAK